MQNSRNAVCTIVSKNYLGYARVFIDSFLKHNKGIDAHVLLVDRVDGYFDAEKENFILTEIGQLDISDLPYFCFKYNVTELNTAVKPFFIEHLFRKYEYEKVIYFDPDILIMNNLNGLFDLLNRFSVVLTPHITSPIDDDGRHISEVDILMAGSYNLGFIGLSHYEKTMNFLSWWKERLYKYCFSAPSQGLFVDQKWIDLVPGFVEDIHILRNPGYNIAYWNLHERTVAYENGEFLVNNQPIYFFHFSGFVFNDIESISKYQDRFSLKDFKGLRLLFERYRDLIVQRDHLNVIKWPYAFGSFDNGLKIHDLIRQLYSGLKAQGKDFGNPFTVEGPDSFFDWLNKPVVTGKPMTNLLHYLYHLRADLQKAFPDPFGNNLSEFISWAKHSLKSEYGFDDRLMPFSDYEEIGPKQDIAAKANSGYVLRSFGISGIKDFVWRYGKKHAKIIKKIPLLNAIAYRVHRRLASEIAPFITTISSGEAVGKMLDFSILKEQEIGVNIAGYIDTESGVAEAARGIIRSVEHAGISFVLNNIEQEFCRRNDKTYTEFSSENPHPVNIIHVNADQAPFVAKVLGSKHFNGKYNIGYWFWELSEFPKEWLQSFSFFNEIWVASDFCLDSVSKSSPIPVVKIPPSVVISSDSNYDRMHFGLEQKNYIFLMMFDFLSFIERKNPMAVVESFRTAFSPDENVTLIIKCINSSYNQPMMENLTKEVNGLNVKLIDKYLDKHELNSLVNLCDCYISLHRSEGFGLPMAEAMLMGKPVIATAYSGNTEFMNINNSFLVKYSLIEIHEDYGPYKKGRVWAEPDVLHAAELMRYVVDNSEKAKKIAIKGAEDISRSFGPGAIGNKIKERMKYVLRKYQ